MMHTFQRSLLALCVAATIQFQVPVFANTVDAPYQTQVVQVQAPVGTTPMTMEQAMAHQDWLGRQPEGAYWSADSAQIVYQRKQQGNELRDWFTVDQQATSREVSLKQQDDIGSAQQVFNRARNQVAWIFAGNVIVKDVRTGQSQQLTRDLQQRQDLQFLTDGRLSWRQGWDFYAADVNTGKVQLVASLKNAESPAAPDAPTGYLAKEQHQLIQFVAKEHKDAVDAFQQQQALKASSDAVAVAPIFLAKDKEVQAASLSPNGRYIVLAQGDKTSWNDERDIMPNYITSTGDVAAEPVRRRVHDQKPEPQQFFFVDLQTQQVTELAQKDLPGFDEDVLADVKAENAKAVGSSYKSVRKARDITLMNDWSWNQGAIRWNPAGDQAAVMLKAWDNKDRWLTTISAKKPQFVTQDRLHDKAWVAYDFNNFDWVDNSSLYYLSEVSGYAHLYVKPLTGKARALTEGRFEVSDPVLSKDGSTIYYRGNETHPGIYNIYKVSVSDGKRQALTNLTGNLTFDLSPDESKLLVRYSTSLQPEELYSMANQPGAELKRLTYTVSDKLKQMALQAPKIIAVPSSHGEQPVYAKLYLPKDHQQGEKRRAVIFNHGAGYLQNSDAGWSNYYHEFFFHNLLVQQGYVVLDMDYRASKGYGRDWRTAIYRNMGTPEIEDLVDGVNYLVEHANVDRNRIGTYGGSYGGFMTFMALFKQPDLFKAGAALRPVADWAYYNQPYTSNILNTPDIDPIAYRRSSPIYFTQGLKAQLLINAPMVDDNVFFQDTVRLVQRLIEQENNNFETAIFPVEPHGFRQPSSWLDEYRRILKLFERTL